jgi:hypothetical protein
VECILPVVREPTYIATISTVEIRLMMSQLQLEEWLFRKAYLRARALKTSISRTWDSKETYTGGRDVAGPGWVARLGNGLVWHWMKKT